MSVFSGLMLEAKQHGVGRLSFAIPLFDFEGAEEDGAERWTCTGEQLGSGIRGSWSHTTTGRTGEEALRRLVDLLKREHAP